MGVNFVDQNHQFISKMTIFFNLVRKRIQVLKLKELGTTLVDRMRMHCTYVWPHFHINK